MAQGTEAHGRNYFGVTQRKSCSLLGSVVAAAAAAVPSPPPRQASQLLLASQLLGLSLIPATAISG